MKWIDLCIFMNVFIFFIPENILLMNLDKNKLKVKFNLYNYSNYNTTRTED